MSEGILEQKWERIWTAVIFISLLYLFTVIHRLYEWWTRRPKAPETALYRYAIDFKMERDPPTPFDAETTQWVLVTPVPSRDDMSPLLVVVLGHANSVVRYERMLLFPMNMLRTLKGSVVPWNGPKPKFPAIFGTAVGEQKMGLVYWRFPNAGDHHIGSSIWFERVAPMNGRSDPLFVYYHDPKCHAIEYHAQVACFPEQR